MKHPIEKFVNALLILAILGTLTLEGKLLLGRAQEAPESGDAGADQSAQPESAPQDATGKCVQDIKDFMAVKKVEFGQFMNDHFQSDKPTSQLIETAIEKYRQYREDVRIRIGQFLPQAGDVAPTANQERAACNQAAAEDFELMKELIRQHIAKSAVAKKSTRLLDEYRTINGKLEKLNFTIAQTYGYFSALAQKLPCYATQCVKQ